MFREISSCGLGLALLTIGCAPSGEDTRTSAVRTPTHTLPQPFGLVSGFRVLSDGRVMVGDPLGQALVVVDLAAGTADTIGRVGAGPREYQQPDGLLPLTGDTTLLVDLGNARLTEVTPDGWFGETMPIVTPATDGPMGIAFILPRGRDLTGRFYLQQLPFMPASGPPDSGAVTRYDPGAGRIDTVAMVKLQARVRTTGPGGTVSTRRIPLSPEDDWALGSDGRLALARAGDYHLEWIELDGRVTAGPPLPYRPVAIGTAEKQEFVDNAGVGGLTIQIAASGGGAVDAALGRGGSRGDRSIDDYPDWPDVLPPFVANRMRVSPAGQAWVLRRTAAGGNTHYDIFDSEGNPAGTFVIPPRRRVVGFGPATVFVVYRDEFDLEYLEAYRAP